MKLKSPNPILRGEEGVVSVEDHEGVLVGVAAEEEGTGVPVERVRDKPHWACHRCDHHLRELFVFILTILYYIYDSHSTFSIVIYI